MESRIRDGIDRNLIAALEEDARVSAAELSRKLRIARSTVNERISRLERDGIILGYSAIVRNQCEDTDARSLLFLKCERGNIKRTVASLKQFPEIMRCFSITGIFDLACYVETPLSEDLDALIDEMSQVSGVLNIDSTMILSTRFTRAPEKAAPISSDLKLVAS